MERLFKKGKLSYRILSVMLSLLMVLSCTSMNSMMVFAEGDEGEAPAAPTDYVIERNQSDWSKVDISGVDTTMEYSTDGGSTWYDVPGSKIEGLAGGTTVHIRIKGTEDAYDGSVAIFEVQGFDTLDFPTVKDILIGTYTISSESSENDDTCIQVTDDGIKYGKRSELNSQDATAVTNLIRSNINEITVAYNKDSITKIVFNTSFNSENIERCVSAQLNGEGSAYGVEFTVNYNMNDGAWAAGYTAPTKSNYPNEFTFPATDKVVKDGYRFIGWKDANNDLGENTFLESVSLWLTGDITVNAVFSEKENGRTISGNVIAVAPTASGNTDGKIINVDSDMEYSTDDGSNWVDVSGTEITGTLPVGAKVKVRYKETAYQKTGAEKEFIIPKLPGKTLEYSHIIVYTTSAAGQNDGKITGVSDEMEYKLKSSAEWTPVETSATEIIGLAVGTYQLRYKETDDYAAGWDIELEISDPHLHTWTFSKSGNKLIAKSLCHNEEDCWHRSEVQVVKELTISVNGNINSGSTPTVTTGTDSEKGAWVKSGLYNPTEEEVKFYASTGVGSTTKTGDALSSAPDKAGNYVAEYTYSGDVAATNVPVAIAFTINKIDPTATAPTAVNSLTYTGSDLTLVSEGNTSDGTIQYALSLEGPFSANLPKAMNAGTYSVYYKVVGDSEHNDKVFTTPVSVTVSKKTQEAIANPSIAETGINRVKVNVPTDDRAGTIKYIQAASTPNANAAGWSPSPTITGLSAGTTYTVYVMFSGDENHEPVISAGESVTTEKPAATQPTGLDAVGPTNEGGADGKITGVDSSMEYSANGESWNAITGTDITGLISGTYFVRVAGDASYSASSSVEIFVPVTSSSSPVVSEVESTISGEVVSEVETESLGDIAKELAEEETSGEKVEVKLEVKTQTEISDNSIKQSITNLLDKIVQAAIRVVTYLEIDINKIVGNGGSSSVEETSKVIEIVISVSSKTVNNNPVVVRNHGGVSVTFNKVDAKPTSNFIDGTFYIDKENCKIYIYTKYFSDYALVSAEGHTVTLESNGGSTENAIIVDNGGRVTTLPTPTKSGYSFGGWYTDNSTFNNRFTTSTTVNDDITVYAKWVSNTPGGGGGNSGNTTPGNNTPSTPAQVAPVTEIKAVSVGGYLLNSWDSIAAAATRISAEDVKKTNSSKEALLQVDISSSSNKEIPKDVVQLIKKSNLDGLHVFVGEGDAVTFVKDENYSKYNGMSFSHKDTVTANSRTIDFVNKGNLNAKVVFHTVAAPSKTVELYKVVKGKEVKIGTLVTTKEGRICFEISELATYILKY